MEHLTWIIDYQCYNNPNLWHDILKKQKYRSPIICCVNRKDFKVHPCLQREKFYFLNYSIDYSNCEDYDNNHICKTWCFYTNHLVKIFINNNITLVHIPKSYIDETDTKYLLIDQDSKNKYLDIHTLRCILIRYSNLSKNLHLTNSELIHRLSYYSYGLGIRSYDPYDSEDSTEEEEELPNFHIDYQYYMNNHFNKKNKKTINEGANRRVEKLFLKYLNT